jgi:hypothetical protein
LVALLIALQGGAVVAQIPNPVETAPAVVEPSPDATAGEETQTTVTAPEVQSEEVPASTETAVEPAAPIEEVVTTVEDTAVAIAESVDTVVGQIEETVAAVEQATTPVEEPVATPELTTEVTTDSGTGGQVTDPVQTQETAAEPVVAVIETEQPANVSPDPVDVATETAGPIDAVEVHGGAFQETVTTVEETVAAGPVDAVEVLGGAYQETVTTAEETVAAPAGPVDAVEVLGGAYQETVATVEETVAAPNGPIDAVEALGGAFQETVAIVEETAPVLAGPIDAVEVLGGVYQETVTTVEGAGEEIIAAVESLEAQVQETVVTVEATAEEIVDSVSSVGQTAGGVDLLATLDEQVHETVASVQKTTEEIAAVLEVLDTGIEETVSTVETTTENVVDAAVAAGATEQTVESLDETAQQAVAVVEVLQVQIDKALATMGEASEVVELIETIESQVSTSEAPSEAATQQMVNAVEGLVTEIESSLSPVEETAPQVVVAVEGLVGKIEDTLESESITMPRVEVSSAPSELTAAEPADPGNAVEVAGGDLAARQAAVEGVLLVGKTGNPADVGEGLGSATKKASNANTSDSFATTDDAPGPDLLRGSRTTANAKGAPSLAARFVLNSSAILSGSQPSLAILVDAVNDADGDGIYSDTEFAARPAADVSFKALITNIGAVSFEIANVTNGYNGGTGPAQGEVCGELVGIMLAPGESVACAFPVAEYAPEGGASAVNTITAAGFEVGKGARRGASDSDTSTVQTILAGDDVLAVALKRNLAFTGTDAGRLVALGLLLLAAGGGLLSLARIRNRPPVRPFPSESPIDALGWWAAGPRRAGSNRRVGRG